jgi:uncharacterized protein (UPF0333 family)
MDNRPLVKKIIVLAAVIAVILVGVRMMNNGKKAAPAPAPNTGD